MARLTYMWASLGGSQKSHFSDIGAGAEIIATDDNVQVSMIISPARGQSAKLR
jgi:hypothetical protein